MNNTIFTIAHIIISAIKPRSFMSPILLGLSSMMHRKHASKGLIDCLSNLGLCASYYDTQLFESSIVKNPDNYTISTDSFLQCIFDNADHNTATIDGRNTFHAMGGIMSVTPSSAVTSVSNIPKLKNLPTSNQICDSFGFLPIKQLNIALTGFQKIKVKSITFSDVSNYKIDFSCLDFLWLFGKKMSPTAVKGWMGYREVNSRLTNFGVSKIIPLQFVNTPPSNYDTILTVLIEAARKSEANGQIHAFVTFDQPLYWKAREIIASVDSENDVHGIRNVIVRLGGFHTLMSFLGAIGYLMESSGLKEAFEILYADNSSDKALAGHAFSRAIRGHILNLAALGSLIIDECSFSDDEIQFLNNLSATKNLCEYEFTEDPLFMALINKFNTKLKSLKENGPTAQLWVQYFHCVVITLNFYHAERSGNFELHLQSIKEMLPYFHASGHHSYAKSAHLYLQDMMELRSILDPNEYDQFIYQGFFTIRRSEKFWCGVWSDMTIEQVLMRSIKCVGGLTHGRGMNESTIAKFLACTVVLLEICNEMENFCSSTYDSSEQHVDARSSRMSRDASDLKKLLQFYEERNPFTPSDKIRSIYSGLVGNGKINCHEALEIGIKLLNNINGKSFDELKIPRKDKVLPLSAMSSKIKIKNNVITIQPLLIFQRICLNINEKTNMKHFCNNCLTKHIVQRLKLKVFSLSTFYTVSYTHLDVYKRQV